MTDADLVAKWTNRKNILTNDGVKHHMRCPRFVFQCVVALLVGLFVFPSVASFLLVLYFYQLSQVQYRPRSGPNKHEYEVGFQFFRLNALIHAFLVYCSLGSLCSVTFFPNLPTLPLKLWHSNMQPQSFPIVYNETGSRYTVPHERQLLQAGITKIRNVLSSI